MSSDESEHWELDEVELFRSESCSLVVDLGSEDLVDSHAVTDKVEYVLRLLRAEC